MSVSTHAAESVATEAKNAADVRARLPFPPELAVSRTAVVNHLRTHPAPIVLITAPAGYGKSTVLAQWAARDLRRFAFVRLEPGMDETELGDLVWTAGAGEAPRPSSARAIVRELGRHVLASGEPLVLVIDGTEHATGTAAQQLFAGLATNLPAQAQLVLAGRHAPPLPLARLRAEGRLLELHAQDLKLTERETQGLLHRLHVDLEVNELHDVHERAEGWPLGVAMCGHAIQPSRGRPGRSPRGFGGAHHFVADYLEQEVLAALPEELVAFATRCSILDRMNGPLCDAVLGEEGSADRLHALAVDEVFVFPVDREHTWFRFHRFFRDALQIRLAQHEPARFTELSRRAAAWYEDTGDIRQAIAHLRAVRDSEHAADLLGALAEDVCTRGTSPGDDTLRDLADEQMLARHPAAAVTGALAHAMEGRVSEAARWSAAAAPAADAGVALMRAALCHDGVDQMCADARLALAHLPQHSPFTPFALMLLGIGQTLTGDRAAAEAALTEAAELAGEAAPVVATVAFGQLSLMAQDEGAWERAEDFARTARDHANALDGGDHVFAALAYAASARSALRNSNWVRAGDDLERIEYLLPRANEAFSWLAALVRIHTARAHLALNDIGAADELVAELEHLVLVRPHLGRAEDALRDLHRQIDGLREVPRDESSLTAAELRLLPLLTTHLTFRQIAQHLYVSRNTIKTQAISIYRKLGVSSRTTAIDRAIELGLLRNEGDSLRDRT